jgi:hypothetical protein
MVIALFVENSFFSEISDMDILVERRTFYQRISFIFLFCTVFFLLLNADINILCRKLKWLIVSLFLLLSYIICWSLFNKTGFNDMHKFFNGTVISVIPLLYLSLNKKTTNKQIKNFIYVFFIIQFIFVVLQQNGIYTYHAHKFRDGLLTRAGASIISGTFHRFNQLADTLLILFTMVSIEFFSYKNKPLKIYYCYILFFILSFYMIFLSGARTALILFAVFLLIIALLYFKNNRKLTLTICMLFVLSVLFVFGLNIKGYSSLEATSTIERQIYGLATLFTNTSSDSETTLMASEILIKKYFFKNPIFGSALSESDYYVINGVAMSDSRIAFILANYGLIGLLCIMIFFISLLKFLKKEFLYENKFAMQKIYIIFFLLLCLGITETGLWGKLEMIMFLLYSYYLSFEKTLINFPNSISKK